LEDLIGVSLRHASNGGVYRALLEVEESSMALTAVGKFSLHNGGGFVARQMFTYMNDNGEKVATNASGDVTLGQTQEFDPGAFGVPDGATLWSYVFVLWGYDNEAKQGFTYKKGAPRTAAYTITGTTLSNTLGLISSS
jgi:hypothetical protein